MSTITQATAFTKIKQPTDHDSRNFGPLVHGYEAQVSTAAQTTVNLTQFVCDLANKSQIMVYVDGNLLTEGVGNDYVWVAGLNNTSSQLTLASPIVVGLNIQIYKIGAPRVNLPTADSINATINLVQDDSDKKSQQYIGNGAFDFWQEGTSFAAIGNGVYFADQWIYSKSGAMVHTASRSTDLASTSKSTYSALIDCTTADASIAAGDYAAILTKIEGNILRSFRGKNLVLGFTVKANKTGVSCVSLQNSAQDRNLVKEFTINSSATHERKYIRFSHDEAGTWLYDSGVGIQVRFALAAGTTFQTTADTWQSGLFFATANQVNHCDSAANNFTISDVILCEDNASLNYEPDFKYFNDSYVAEERLIKRYFYNLLSGYTGIRAAISVGVAVTNGTVRVPIPLPSAMRVLPSVTISNVADFKMAAAGTDLVITAVVVNQCNPSIDQIWLQIPTTSSAINVVYAFTPNNVTGALIYLNSRM